MKRAVNEAKEEWIKKIIFEAECAIKDGKQIQLDDREIATVEDFTYLGSNITTDDEVKNEVAVKLGKVPLAAHDSLELVSHAQYDLQIWGTTPFCPVLPCIKCPLYSCSL